MLASKMIRKDGKVNKLAQKADKFYAMWDRFYSYIGFNYILTSIAVGGFFIIPSKRSYLWVILLIPIVAMITISLSRVFTLFSLPIYSLPFNLVVLLFLAEQIISEICLRCGI